MKESRIPLITALFCGLLLHTEFTAMASDGATAPGDAAPAASDTVAAPGGAVPAVEGRSSATPTPATTRKEHARRFELADRDHDGSLTREEAAHPETGLPVVSREFTAIDANGDGKLSKAELLRFARERRQANQARRAEPAS